MTNYQTGMGVSSLGSVIGSIANILASNSIGDTVHNSIAEQGRFADQAGGVWREGLPAMTAETATRQIGEGSAHRQEVYGQATGTKSTGNQGIAGPDKRDQAAIGMAGANRAGVSGYSDWQIQQMLAKIKTQEQLNRIASQAQGQASLIPYNLNAAEHQYDWMSALGGATGTAGNVIGLWDFLGPMLKGAGSGASQGNPYDSW